jgi:hypothetical protein
MKSSYEKFKTYLSNVRTALGKEESGEEIIADIEARYCRNIQPTHERKRAPKSWGLADVEFIIETLGQPEAFIDEPENEAPKSSS